MTNITGELYTVNGKTTKRNEVQPGKSVLRQRQFKKSCLQAAPERQK